MIGIYFSGTGNTKYIVTRLLKNLDNNGEAIALEDKATIEKIKNNDTLILGYPTHFSNCPVYVRDFIKSHKEIWKDKRVLIVATMGAMSGDGAGCSARILKKYGAIILGGLHVKMPDSVADSKLLKKSREENLRIIENAEKKVDLWSERIINNRFPHDGLTIFHHIGGLFGQRLWFYSKTKDYSKKLKIDKNKCIGCGKCVELCPINNLSLKEGKSTSNNRCTMCYRCISLCPVKAITCVGDKVVEQIRLSDYR